MLQACEQLVAEGYATGRARSGTFVAAVLPARAAEPRAARNARHRIADGEPNLSALGRRLALAVAPGRASWSPWQEPLPFDFRYGEPSYADLPLETWSRILGRRARRLSAGDSRISRPAARRSCARRSRATWPARAASSARRSRS